MAKREREEEFEVSEVAPLQPLSRYSLLLRYTLHCQYSATVQKSLPLSVVYYRIAGYFRGMYISRIATSILVHEN